MTPISSSFALPIVLVCDIKNDKNLSLLPFIFKVEDLNSFISIIGSLIGNELPYTYIHGYMYD